MHHKRISDNLRKAHYEWAMSITDESVQALAFSSSFIAGGAIASSLLDDIIRDYDIYFTTQKAAYAMAKYYVDMHNSTSGQKVHVVAEEDGSFEIKDDVHRVGVVETTWSNEEQRFRTSVITSNAITLTNKTQLVIRFFGEPSTVVQKFDFAHTKNYWSPLRGLVLNNEAVESLLTRELIYTGSQYPVASLMRAKKYIERSWNISAGQLVKIAMDISKLDLHNVRVLADQLVGVDLLLFKQVIDRLANDSESVDSLYIFNIIDEIFS